MASASASGWAAPSEEQAIAGLDEQARGYVSAEAVTALREKVLSTPAGSAWKAGCHFLDDVSYLRRWLVAREGDLEKSSAMLLRHIQWRNEECPWFPELPPVDEITEDLATGKVMVHGRDAEGRPCMYVFAGRHSVYDTTAERTQKLVIYSIERAFASAGDAESGIAVFDFSDAGWGAMDTDAAKYVIKMLSLNYPETLKKIYIVNHGMVFSALWAIISPFLSARTTAKIEFVATTDLLDRLPAAAVPVSLGGAAAVEPDGKGGSKPLEA